MKNWSKIIELIHILAILCCLRAAIIRIPIIMTTKTAKQTNIMMNVDEESLLSVTGLETTAVVVIDWGMSCFGTSPRCSARSLFCFSNSSSFSGVRSSSTPILSSIRTLILLLRGRPPKCFSFEHFNKNVKLN